VQIVRNGSRGLLWLEPMVEVETAEGRIAYGPVTVEDIASLISADFLAGGAHKLRLGNIEDHPYLKNQERLTFARCGITDPVSVADYVAHGGFEGLRKALALSGAAIVAEVTESGLRGRGGAGFPTGIKWKTVHDAVADQKYICCNADEGDSGTFADRMVMEGDPLMLIEGMTIAGLAVGATKGYIYIRSEYPDAIVTMNEAIAAAVEANWLGARIFRVRTSPSISRSAAVRAPISAAKKPPCWNRSRASAAWCASSRRSRRSKACSASRPSSTTC
jgi:formate dehydrogenase iron-sulfur subunit